MPHVFEPLQETAVPRASDTRSVSHPGEKLDLVVFERYSHLRVTLEWGDGVRVEGA